MKNDWETRRLPPPTLGIIRVTSLWLDQKNLFDIIAGSTLGMMACLLLGEGGVMWVGVREHTTTHRGRGGRLPGPNHQCRVNLYFASSDRAMNN